MSLLKIARVPPITIGTSATIRDAVDLMNRDNAGAVVIVKGGRALGIFTARDLLRRVVSGRLPLDSTPLTEVMTSPLTVARRETTCEEAMELMVNHKVHHLPIVDEDGRPCGMLSTRHLLRNMVENLSHELHSLDSYFSADGIGG